MIEINLIQFWISWILYFFIFLDMAMSFQVKQSGASILGYQCKKCGGLIIEPVFTILIIKISIHRCDDNLIG